MSQKLRIVITAVESGETASPNYVDYPDMPREDAIENMKYFIDNHEFNNQGFKVISSESIIQTLLQSYADGEILDWEDIGGEVTLIDPNLNVLLPLQVQVCEDEYVNLVSPCTTYSVTVYRDDYEDNNYYFIARES